MPESELGFSKKSHARFGGCNTLRRTLKQPCRKFAFKLGHLLAERRLNQIQIEGSAADAAQLDHPDERAQLTKFHGSS